THRLGATVPAVFSLNPPATASLPGQLEGSHQIVRRTTCGNGSSRKESRVVFSGRGPARRRFRSHRELPLRTGRLRVPFFPAFQTGRVTMTATLMRMFLVLAASAAGAAPAAAAPCTDATDDCTQWVAPASGAARLLVYSTYALDKRNEGITRALVTIHGGGRNADNYFRSSVAAGFLANALDDTIIVSPRFASNDGGNCKDALAANELNWPCTGNNWGRGGAAVGNAEITSYDLA